MKRLLTLLLVLSFPFTVRGAGSRFVDKDAGISFELPPGWQMLSDPSAPKPPESQPRVIARMAKYKAPYDGVNPTFAITFLPLPDEAWSVAPDKLLRGAMPEVTRAFPDAEFEVVPRATMVTEVPAAEMVVRYTTKTATGGTGVARARIVYVHRKDHLLTIRMITPAEGDDQAKRDLANFMDSVVVEHALEGGGRWVR